MVSENSRDGPPDRRDHVLMDLDREMDLDHEACYRAICTRDARFDGRLFIGVKTTGIYCRPVCPARTPRRENLSFYPSAAAAQEAGFRPCLRCRPETAPDLGVWRGTSNTVSRALSLIEKDGAGWRATWRPSPSGWESASGSSAGSFASISARRRSRWRRRGVCCWPSS